MCGIAGYIASSHSPSPILSHWNDYALKSMHHRGPDDCGVFANPTKTVSLIHTAFRS